MAQECASGRLEIFEVLDNDASGRLGIFEVRDKDVLVCFEPATARGTAFGPELARSMAVRQECPKFPRGPRNPADITLDADGDAKPPPRVRQAHGPWDTLVPDERWLLMAKVAPEKWE